jgi:hypothetical protein
MPASGADRYDGASAPCPALARALGAAATKARNGEPHEAPFADAMAC